MAVRRGEIYWVDFDPARGSEQRGRRPGLVVQNDRGNQYSDITVVAAISSSQVHKPYPFVVLLDAGEGGLHLPSHVNCAQLLTVAQDRLVERIGSLTHQRMLQVSAALRFELDC